MFLKLLFSLQGRAPTTLLNSVTTIKFREGRNAFRKIIHVFEQFSKNKFTIYRRIGHLASPEFQVIFHFYVLV